MGLTSCRPWRLGDAHCIRSSVLCCAVVVEELSRFHVSCGGVSSEEAGTIDPPLPHSLGLNPMQGLAEGPTEVHKCSVRVDHHDNLL
jgi:hypothetical protein